MLNNKCVYKNPNTLGNVKVIAGQMILVIKLPTRPYKMESKLLLNPFINIYSGKTIKNL
jgi:hypothetical protein